MEFDELSNRVIGCAIVATMPNPPLLKGVGGFWNVQTLNDHCREIPRRYAPAPFKKGDFWCLWELGPGLLESTYEQCLAQELKLNVVTFRLYYLQPVEYKGIRLFCTPPLRARRVLRGEQNAALGKD